MDEKETMPADYPACKHNQYIVCDPNTRCCGNCGWDPDVAAARLKRICKEKHLQNPYEKPKQVKSS